MRRHHWIALAGAIGIFAISFTDAITQVVTGRDSAFATGEGAPALQVASDLVHGACYAALVVVLASERARFAAARVAVRVARPILLVVCAALALGFLVVSPLLALTGAVGGLATAYEAAGTPLLMAMILASLVIGLGTIRRNPLGLGGTVLAWLLPTVLLTVVAAILVPSVAHPFAVESVINIGIALIGARVARSAAVSPQTDAVAFGA